MRAKRSHGLSREMLPQYRVEVELENLNIDPTFLFPTAGYNFRNIEFGAVLGQVQLKKLNKWNKIRHNNYKEFYLGMESLFNLCSLPARPEGNSAMVLPFHCHDEIIAQELKTFLKRKGVETRPFLVGDVRKQPFMKGTHYFSGQLPNTERMDQCSFYIGNNQFVSPANIQALLSDIRCEF